ncbi:hypothetical protein GCM10010191_52630 [Actinomadura vinacea]|uniref:DUF397 domain-containing protein n=1 Tax=Actinomadura vinacea TaxID=115336 RepID=A0ABN3JLP2_9ACTN
MINGHIFGAGVITGSRTGRGDLCVLMPAGQAGSAPDADDVAHITLPGAEPRSRKGLPGINQTF